MRLKVLRVAKYMKKNIAYCNEKKRESTGMCKKTVKKKYHKSIGKMRGRTAGEENIQNQWNFVAINQPKKYPILSDVFSIF